MAAKKRWQASIRMIWAIAKSPELHMDEEDVHALVYRETGKESLKKLSQGELNDVARILQNLKDGAGGRGRTPQPSAPTRAATPAPKPSAARFTPSAACWAGTTTRAASRALSNA